MPLLPRIVRALRNFTRRRKVEQDLADEVDPREKEDFAAGYLTLVGRLKPGVGIEQARSEIVALARSIREKLPNIPADYGTRAQVNSLQAENVAGIRPTLLILLGTVGLVLLIACANVADLDPRRHTAHRRDRTQRNGAHLLVRHLGPRRHALRARAGSPNFQPRSPDAVERRRPHLHRRRRSFPLAARNLGSGPCLDARDQRRTPDQKFLAPPARQSRFRSRPGHFLPSLRAGIGGERFKRGRAPRAPGFITVTFSIVWRICRECKQSAASTSCRWATATGIHR